MRGLGYAAIAALLWSGCGDDGNAKTDAAPPGDDAPVDTPAAVDCTCAMTAPGPTRSSAIAVSPDDKTVVSVNRDAGTVTIARANYADGQPALSKVAELDLGAGCEPWSVAIDA